MKTVHVIESGACRGYVIDNEYVIGLDVLERVVKEVKHDEHDNTADEQVQAILEAAGADEALAEPLLMGVHNYYTSETGLLADILKDLKSKGGVIEEEEVIWGFGKSKKQARTAIALAACEFEDEEEDDDWDDE